MKYVSKLSLVLWLILALPESIMAQVTQLGINPQTLVEPTPDVASMSKYGKLPHSKYTGAATFSLPVYAIKFEDLVLPINLSYNSNGLKVREEASWVGLGWNLQANAVISRTINDADDFLQELNQTVGLKNGWIYQADLELENKDPSRLHLSDALITAISNSKDIPMQKPDTEPDLFTVNLFGISLSFVLGKKGATNAIEGRLLENPTYKVIFYESNQIFQITDDKGYKYSFTTKEYSNLFDGFMQYNIITAWFIDRIESPSGKELLFEYNSSGTQIALRSRQNVIRQETTTFFIENTGCATQPPPPSGGVNFVSLSENSINYLSRIVNGAEEIHFLMSGRADVIALPGFQSKKLDGIKVYFRGVEKRTISFLNSYFDQDRINDAQAKDFLRLKLDRVKIGDVVHVFEYEAPNQLPSKESKAVDLWGYYNGKISNTAVMPRNRISVEVANGSKQINVDGSDRDSDSTFSKIGILNKIIYPTGGYSTFDYSANEIKIPSDQILGWERFESQDLGESSNLSETSSKDFYFNLPVSATFSATTNAVAQLEFNIKKIGGPFDIYNEVNLHANEIAMQLRGPSGQLIKTITFGDFNTFCYADPNAYACNLADNSNYCYCYVSKNFFEGTLAPGSYTVTLNPAISFSSNGSPYTIYPALKIRYPLGPYRNKVVGGIRVSQISDFEKNGMLLSKRIFLYNEDNGNYSSGKLMSMPIFARVNQMAFGFKVSDSPCGYCSGSIDYVQFSSTPVNSSFPSAAGYHIGYSNVEEVFASEKNPMDNYRISSVFNNTPSSESPWIPQMRIPSAGCGSEFYAHYMKTLESGLAISYDKKNGKLARETLYNSSGQKVSESEYSYTYTSLRKFGFAKLSMRNASYFPAAEYRVDGFRNYFHNLDTYHLTTTKTTAFNSTGNIITTNSYTFDDKWYQKTHTVVNSNDDVHKTTDFYVSDYSLFPDLIAKNILAKPVKRQTTVNGNLVEAWVLQYDNIGLISRSYQYESQSLVIPEAHSPAKLVPDDYYPQTEYLYYSTNRMKQYISSDGVPTVFFWGYDGKYVVAQVRGMEYQTLVTKYSPDIFIFNNPSSETQLINELENLRSALQPYNVSITTYTFNPLVGTSTVTDANGRRTRYSYDDHGRLIKVIDHDGNILKEYGYDFEIK